MPEVRPKAPRQYIKTVTPAVRIKKQRPPDRRKAALWAFCFSLSSFSASVCKKPRQGFPGASGVALASYRQVKRPPWALFARRAFFLALLHALRAFNHKNRPIPHVLRVFNHKNRLFPRVFRHQVQLFGSHGLNSFSKLLSSCKQLPDHFRYVTKKVCAMSSWRRANVRLSI